MTAPDATWRAWRQGGMTPYVHWAADRAGTTGRAEWVDTLDDPLRAGIRRDFDVPLDLVLPPHCLNPHFGRDPSWMPGAGAPLPTPPPVGTPIVSVIDVGLPLAHRCLRRPDGGSRVLAAWQQGAAWAASDRAGQSWIPFGREVWRPQIDALLATYAWGPDRFGCDEHGLGEAASLLHTTRADGERDLMRAVSHGAAIAGLAAGREPSEEAAPLIFVTLPGRSSLGLAGGFLNLFAMLALHRIADVADHLWARLPAEAQRDADVAGYPLIVNFSFGLQAGGRHAAAGLAAAVADLNARRRAADRSKLHLVLPAGNDNLLAGQAVLTLTPGSGHHIDWMMPPEDATSNFLEIWSEPMPGGGADGPVGLAIGLTPPGGPTGPLTAGRHGMFCEIGPAVRAYCEVVPDPDERAHRVRYVLCAEPTRPHDIGAPSAPNGRWRLSLGIDGAHDLRVTLSVQTDLPSRRGSAVARRSWLDDGRYERVERATGRRLDTFAYRGAAEERAFGVGGAPADVPPGVARRGTINAFASVAGAIVAAGHRRSDGQPAGYSGAAGLGPTDPAPTVSLPVDRSVAAPGVLTAGSVDGARRAVRGTSVAAALATRLAAPLLRGRPGFDVDLAAELRDLARHHESHLHRPAYGFARPEKVGAGRIDCPDIDGGRWES